MDSKGRNSMTYYLRAYRWHFFWTCVALSAVITVI
jgi:hypothetical protein